MQMPKTHHLCLNQHIYMALLFLVFFNVGLLNKTKEQEQENSNHGNKFKNLLDLVNQRDESKFIQTEALTEKKIKILKRNKSQ